VSGLAALLIERNPRLTPAAVQDILMGTAKDLGPKGRDDEYGAGLVDAYAALRALAPPTALLTH
jgi:subtilisin family serine protease